MASQQLVTIVDEIGSQYNTLLVTPLLARAIQLMGQSDDKQAVQPTGQSEDQQAIPPTGQSEHHQGIQPMEQSEDQGGFSDIHLSPCEFITTSGIAQGGSMCSLALELRFPRALTSSSEQVLISWPMQAITELWP
jgi:hypothetical protein